MYSSSAAPDPGASPVLFPQNRAEAATELAAALARPADSGQFDELFGRADARPDSPLAPHWVRFFGWLGAEGFAELDGKVESLRRYIRDNGMTYNVYDQAGGTTRPWSLDLFPLIVPQKEWAHIEQGVLQRTHLLNEILRDTYGAQDILRRGELPPALVLGHPGYLRPVCGMRPAGNTWLHIAAFDLARGQDGAWWVVSQRTQGPSGLGYLLENRLVIGGLFPDAFRELKVQRLAAAYRGLIESLRRLRPEGSNARVVLLTPGPYNETYFEHAYLARYLGIKLVEGSDLTVRGNHLYLRTLQGLEPVHVVLRRLDDDYLDPLELRADSALGIPGLLQVARAGNVLIANAPGASFLESPGILGFLPRLAERLLGERLVLPALHTWWCGESGVLPEALPQLGSCVVKPTYPTSDRSRTFDPVIGAHLSTEELARWRRLILSNPDNYCLQSYLPLSQTPVWQSHTPNVRGRIEPRSTMLRVFAIADGNGGWRVLPGGLARVASRDKLFTVSMQRGGSSVDTWVLTDGPIDTTTLIRQRMTPEELPAVRSRTVSSRAAENLFWLGRYTERSQNAVRLARVALSRVSGESDADSGPMLALMTEIAASEGILPDLEEHPVPPGVTAFEQALREGLGQEKAANTIGFTLTAMRTAAYAIRERLALDHWNLIADSAEQFGPALEQAAQGPQVSFAARTARALDELDMRLTAVTGLQTDHMTRDDGWRLLSVGVQIERLSFLARTLRTAAELDVIGDADAFELLLDLFDSSVTFRSQFQRTFELVPLIDQVVRDRDNPRSLAWVAHTLRGRLSKIARCAPDELSDLARGIPSPETWSFAALVERDSQGQLSELCERLTSCLEAVWALSDRVTERYFSHVRRAEQTTWA